MECPLRPVIPRQNPNEGPRRKRHAEQEEQGARVRRERLDDLRDRGVALVMGVAPVVGVALGNPVWPLASGEFMPSMLAT